MNKTENKMYNFMIFFISQTVSELGTSMTGFATVIWMYSNSGQVMSSSLLAICSTVPYLIVSLLGGVVVDKMNKKKIMLICDSIAAAGSVILLGCYILGYLQLWVLCLVNIINGFMNAFQNPASQVTVTLLVEQKDYARIGGIQSTMGALVGIFQPILATTILNVLGLQWILIVDLCTFVFAFLVLLFVVQIPDEIASDSQSSFSEIWNGLKEGIDFISGNRPILMLLIMYCILEFIGAISFDGMFTPLLLARTNNNETIVGIVSSFMAIGCIVASVILSMMEQPKKKLPIMYFGSYMCLIGITLFGMGRSLVWWCIVVFIGCFGSPIYHTYQTIIIREKVDASMQGRVFSLQGMITQALTPLGFLGGGMLADYIFEPLMKKMFLGKNIITFFVGRQNGSGIGLIFVIAGLVGIAALTILKCNPAIKELEQ
jgi:hypothetical protein